jgi:hypothetical protein
MLAALRIRVLRTAGFTPRAIMDMEPAELAGLADLELGGQA